MFESFFVDEYTARDFLEDIEMESYRSHKKYGYPKNFISLVDVISVITNSNIDINCFINKAFDWAYCQNNYQFMMDTVCEKHGIDKHWVVETGWELDDIEVSIKKETHGWLITIENDPKRFDF